MVGMKTLIQAFDNRMIRINLHDPALLGACSLAFLQHAFKMRAVFMLFGNQASRKTHHAVRQTHLLDFGRERFLPSFRTPLLIDFSRLPSNSKTCCTSISSTGSLK